MPPLNRGLRNTVGEPLCLSVHSATANHVFTCVDTEARVPKDGVINAHSVSGGVSPHVLNFGTGLSCVVIFTFRCFTY